MHPRFEQVVLSGSKIIMQGSYLDFKAFHTLFLHAEPPYFALHSFTAVSLATQSRIYIPSFNTPNGHQTLSPRRGA